MQSALISILLPVKNASIYLFECLDTIVEQSEKHWELIAVDDHSTDGSYDVLQKYAQKDHRITVLKNDQQGIIPALRKAFKNSKGVLITRMDADDRMPVQKLEKLKANLLQLGPGHLSTGLVEYFSTDKLGNGYLKYQNWLNRLSSSATNYKDIYKECVIPSPCWMVFREDLERCGAFEPNRYPEDYDLCFRFYQQKIQVKAVPEILHQWRDHPERTSRNDPNYADIHFFDLKIHYFLKLDYDPQRTLTLWGTGRKGKELAKLLIQNNITFRWITDNIKKIGKDIYNIRIESIDVLQSAKQMQVIVAIAAPTELFDINQKLAKQKFIQSKDVFFFC